MRGLNLIADLGREQSAKEVGRGAIGERKEEKKNEVADKVICFIFFHLTHSLGLSLLASGLAPLSLSLSQSLALFCRSSDFASSCMLVLSNF